MISAATKLLQLRMKGIIMVKLEKVNPKPLIVITIDYDTALCLGVLINRNITEESKITGSQTDNPVVTDLGKLADELTSLLAGD